MDAGTTRRLLVTLRDEGVVGQSQKTGNYFLAMQVMRWAAAVPDGKSLRDIAETSLNELSNHIRTTVFLSVLHEDSAVCLSRFHGDAPVQVRWWSVGGTLPLNCGAAPRLLLAYLPEDERERIINAPLIALTSQSMTNRDELRAELERIRATGWSHARDDVAEGLSALAAPIRDETGAVVAAVSLGGLSPTVASPEGIDPPPRAYTELLRCCKKITQELALDDFTS
ncbi:transcriptional regulator, IclR family [Sulfitobacter brevis]|uniref:Transcriptional regulator, IclR family n=1 Tax=Sulfitobacter brevis TaxID=74348 RepID=A0A1I2BXM0_9RHOB|nr:transcriptional regulator, IclR family [Sulfitobacter brevis]